MTRRQTGSAAILLLLALWVILILGSRGVSLTMDEPYHIARGYTYLARGRAGFWYFSRANNPPLLNAAQGALIYLGDPDIPLETLDGWGHNFKTFTDAMMPYLLPLERTEVIARMPSLLLTVTLAAVVLRWATSLGGGYAGLLALFLFAFDPLILANGRLATTDLGVTAVGTAALYCTWRWYQDGRWRSALATGALIGLVLLTKYSSVLYAATVGVVGIVALVVRGMQGSPGRRNQGEQPRRRKLGQQDTALRQACRTLAQLVSAGLLALCIIWAGFLFSVGQLGTLSIDVPAPVFWNAVLGLRSAPSTRITVLLGDVRYGSSWWYFPLNFLIRNPLPLIGAFLVGAFAFVRRCAGRAGAWHLLLFPALYSLLAMFQGINVSYRHMLPVHPYIHIIASLGLVSTFRRAGIRGVPPRTPLTVAKLGAVVAAAWYVFSTLMIVPDELAYFNELVGGPEGAPRVLVDYAQDWGQYFKALADYLDENPGPKPQVFVFTPTRPDHYGIDYNRLEDVARFHPQPGQYVLGPGPVYGLVGEGQRRYDWFRHRAPTDFIAHALYIYDVTSHVEWVAQCTTPVQPLDESAITEGFRSQTLRRIDFDCTQSWIYPAELATPDGIGTYALHDDLLERQHCHPLSLSARDPEAKDTFVARHLSQLRLAYEQLEYQRLPAFALYEQEEDVIALRPSEVSAYPAPVGTVPSTLWPGSPAVDQAEVGAYLVFEGVQTYPGDNSTVVETWWRVVDGSMTELFSIFAHLVTPEGLVLGGDDGLGVSPLTLATGDVIVQRHAFPEVDEPVGLWLRTGVYWLDDPDERWSVDGCPGDDALFVPLTEKLQDAREKEVR